MEVVLHVSRVSVLPSLLLGRVFADRRKLLLGQCSLMLGAFHKFCLNKYRKQSTPPLNDCGNPLLPYVYYADLALFLGEDTSAYAVFSCQKLKAVPVDVFQRNEANLWLQRSPPRPALISVFPDRKETIAERMGDFFSRVVGNLPQLVHVDVGGPLGLTAIDTFMVLTVPRLDNGLVPRATTVTYTLAATACHNGSHYNAIVVGADGLHWDYDCIGSALLVQRARAASTSPKPGYYFKAIIYRLVSEAPIDAPMWGGCHVMSGVSTCDTSAPMAKLHSSTTTRAEPTRKEEGVCKRKRTATVYGPQATRHDRLTNALIHARKGQRPIGLKGFTARTLKFGGSLSDDTGSEEESAGSPAAQPLVKHREAADHKAVCVPADPHVRSLRAPTMSTSMVAKNLEFLRDCTGERGYRYVESPAGAVGMTALSEDAHLLASRVLYHADHTVHGVHQPGLPNKPNMWYFNYEGEDTGGRNTARVTPAALEPACIGAHDRLLKHAMRGTLSGHVDSGVAQIIHTGILCENIDKKCTRDKGERDPEKYTRALQHSDGSLLSKDRSRTDAMRLFDDSCGAAGFAWRSQTVLKPRNGALGACHVDSCNRVGEAVVVVIIILTEHGGRYTYISCILFCFLVLYTLHMSRFFVRSLH